ncbi:hypothetical protein lerEdw1_000377 [Lerista edwardsae]|nr:hypothetical protein lerEdw1_000377 [Lerista edwardsae]
MATAVVERSNRILREAIKCSMLHKLNAAGPCCWNCLQGAKRYLLTEDVVRLHEFQRHKLTTGYQIYGNKDTYFRTMEEKLLKNRLILKDELKTLLHLCQTKNDVDIAKRVIYRYHAENKNVAFGDFKFGPLFMRLCYELNLEASALELIKDQNDIQKALSFYTQIMKTESRICGNLKAASGDLEDLVQTLERASKPSPSDFVEKTQFCMQVLAEAREKLEANPALCVRFEETYAKLQASGQIISQTLDDLLCQTPSGKRRHTQLLKHNQLCLSIHYYQGLRLDELENLTFCFSAFSEPSGSEHLNIASLSGPALASMVASLANKLHWNPGKQL